ncbi:MAG: LamG-like jellyroll fold domain-containing protein, partial [Sumerlaeia bacterium]
MFSPRADVTFDNGVIYGTMVAVSVTGYGQFNHHPTMACVPSLNGGDGTATPTPTSTPTATPTDSPTPTPTPTPVPNRPPVAYDWSASGDEDTTISLQVLADDPDDDPLTFEVVSEPTSGTLSGDAPFYEYRGFPDFFGTDAFTFRANDGQLSSNTGTVSITVIPVNDPPRAYDAEITVLEDESYLLELLADDIDGDVLSYTIIEFPGFGTLTEVGGSAGVYVYTPFPDYFGPDSFVLLVSDSTTDSEEAVVLITVLPVNDPPVAYPQVVSTEEDTSLSLSLTGEDPDGDSIHFLITESPRFGMLASDGVGSTYVPNANSFGEDSLSFVARDPSGLTSPEAEIRILVTAVNDSPVSQDLYVTLDEDTSTSFLLRGEDVDGDSLFYEIVTSPSLGVLSGELPELIYWPYSDAFGTDSLTYRVTDPEGLSDIGTVWFEIMAVNDPPVADDVMVTLLEDDSAPFRLSGFDVEGAELTFDVIEGPANGRLVGSRADYEYIPDADFNGFDQVIYVANDGLADSPPAVVMFEVLAVNDAPSFMASEVEVDEGATTRTHTFEAWAAFDPGVENEAGQRVHSYIVADVSDTSFFVHEPMIDTSGTLTFVLEAKRYGEVTFSVAVRDDDGMENGGVDLSESQTFRLVINPYVRNRVFTTSGDFDEGQRYRLPPIEPNQLMLDGTASDSNFNNVWLANSRRGTIHRYDIHDGRGRGSYYTGPQGRSASLGPSRTAVDRFGGVWVANRETNTITHIVTPESGRWIDKNGNGVLDTSPRAGVLLPWVGETAMDAEDELIVHHVDIGVGKARALAVTPENNVWASGWGFNRGTWKLVDGETGEILRTEVARPGTVGTSSGYHALMTFNGYLWSTRGLLRWNTDFPLNSPQGVYWDELYFGYCLALDNRGGVWRSGRVVHKYDLNGEVLVEKDYTQYGPQVLACDFHGNVYIAPYPPRDQVMKLDSQGELLGFLPVPVSSSGVSTDKNGKVWVAGYDGRAVRIDPDAGPIGADGKTALGEIELVTTSYGAGAYHFGDMTGMNILFQSSGDATGNYDAFWSVMYDGEIEGASWGPMRWTAEVCNDGDVTFYAAATDDPEAFVEDDLREVDFGNVGLDGTGRYLFMKAVFESSSRAISPVVYDVTVGTEGYAAPGAAPQWRVDAGADGEHEWPLPHQLYGKLYHNTGYETNDLPVQWSVVERPNGEAEAVFDDPQALHSEVRFSDWGRWVLRLTADRDGDVRSDDIVLQLEPVNRGPVATIEGNPYLTQAGTGYPFRALVSDDGLPFGTGVTVAWDEMTMPEAVQFSDAASTEPTVIFAEPGIYRLRLVADDSEETFEDEMAVRVALPCYVETPASIATWWDFEGSGEDIVRNTIAYLTNGAVIERGLISRGLRFDGIDDFARVDQHGAFNLDVAEDGFTIEFWLRYDGPSASDPVVIEWHDAQSTVAGGEGLSIRREGGSNEIRVRLASGIELRTANGAAPGMWTHHAVTLDRRTGEAWLYADGAPVDFKAGLQNVATLTDSDLYFGSRLGTQYFLPGMLDEVCFYNEALSAEKVAAIYGSGDVGKCPPDNRSPVVFAGMDCSGSAGQPLALRGEVTDDGLPFDGGGIRARWEKVSGPGSVVFGDAEAVETSATFDAPGLYLLKLEANDGLAYASDLVEMRVDALCEAARDEALVAWWPGNGTGVDVAGGHDAVLVGGAAFESGVVLSGFAFDGESAAARVTAAPELNLAEAARGFTVDFWVRPTVGDGQVLLEWNAGQDNVGLDYGLSFETNESAGQTVGVQVRLEDGARLRTDNLLIAGQWHHVALTYDAALEEAWLYLDGVPVDLMDDLERAAFDTTGDVYFGNRSQISNVNHFEGMLDEIAMTARALDGEEVYGIFSAGGLGRCPADGNSAPRVSAGADAVGIVGEPVELFGAVFDDGLPSELLIATWSVLEGPGQGVIAEPYSSRSSAAFDAPGQYLLQLEAHDGLAVERDRIVVRIDPACFASEQSPLVAWWPANGDGADVVGGADLARRGGLDFGPGRALTGLVFDGIDDSAVADGGDLRTLGESAGGFTVEFWIYPSAGRGSARQRLVEWPSSDVPGMLTNKMGLTLIGYTPRVDLKFADGAEQTWSASISPLAPGVWQHLALVVDRGAGVFTMAIDGVPVATRALVSTAPLSTDSRLEFGASIGLAEFFQGALDDLAVHRRPLSQQDLATIVATGAVDRCPPDGNAPPVAGAGPDLVWQGGEALALQGAVSDDGLPAGGELTAEWEQFFGPGMALFANPADARTTAAFDADGQYVLRLTASDGLAASSDLMTVRVNTPCLAEADASVVAWWTGDGTHRDAVAGREALLYGDSSYTTGTVAAAFAFDGDGDGALIEHDGDLDLGAGADGFTVEFWMKPDAAAAGGSSRPIVRWSGGLEINVYRYDSKDVEVRLPLAGSTTVRTMTGNDVLSGDAWTHVALRVDYGDSVAQLFADGVLVAATSLTTGGRVKTAGDLFFGRASRLNSSTASEFQGALDEVGFYSRPLSSPALVAIYLAGASGKCAGGDNLAPLVDAGPDIAVSVGEGAVLSGSALDDGLPGESGLTAAWRLLAGPGVVAFANAADFETTANFTAPGLYLLELTASDGLARASDIAEVRVDSPCVVAGGDSLLAWWSGNGTLVDAVGGLVAEQTSGLTTYGPGKVGLGLPFDQAVESKFRVASAPAIDLGLRDAFTVEFWVLNRQVSTYVSWGGGTRIDLFGGRSGFGRLQATLVSETGSSRTILTSYAKPQNVWSHVAMTFDRASGVAAVFIDGVPDAQITGLQSHVFPTGEDFLWGSSLEGTLDEIGFHGRALEPAEIAAIHGAGEYGRCPLAAGNRAPRVRVAASRTMELTTETTGSLTLSGLVADDGLPATGTLTTRWSLLDGPGSLAIEAPADLETPALVTGAGEYRVALAASDGELWTTGTMRLTVDHRPNVGPVVDAGPDAIVAMPASASLDGSASDDGLPLGAALTFEWQKLSGPGAVTFADASAPQTQAQFSAPGIYALRLMASDGDLAASDVVLVTVRVAPTVTLKTPADGTFLNPGETADVRALALDADGFIARVSFYANGELVGVDETFPYRVDMRNLDEGVYRISAIAEDNEGFTGASAVARLVVGLDDGEAPRVEIVSPTEGASITEPTDILGVVESPILDRWHLEFRFEGCPGDSDWTLLATGDSEAAGGLLATLDTTLLLNGGKRPTSPILTIAGVLCDSASSFYTRRAGHGTQDPRLHIRREANALAG